MSLILPDGLRYNDGMDENLRERYDDDAVLTEYVWNNYAHLMTQAERFAQKTGVNDPDSAEQLERHFGADVWSGMRESVRDGYPAFRIKVRDRLLREHANAVLIVRCPRCHRIVKTPKARQCLWCGHDWHSP